MSGPLACCNDDICHLARLKLLWQNVHRGFSKRKIDISHVIQGFLALVHNGRATGCHFCGRMR